MRRGAVAAIGLLALVSSEATACTRSGLFGQPFTLNSDWRTDFQRQFDHAEGVYVVRASGTGVPTEYPAATACDVEEPSVTEPFPLPPRRRDRTPDLMRAHAEMVRTYPARQAEAERKQTACSLEHTRFNVLTTLKGPALRDFIERRSLLDVVDEQTTEPVTWEKSPAFFSSVFPFAVHPCGATPARRLSSRSTYLVFVDSLWTSPGVTPQNPSGRWTRDGSYVGAAYLVTDDNPFLREAKRLSALPHQPPYDANAPIVINDAALADKPGQAGKAAAGEFRRKLYRE